MDKKDPKTPKDVKKEAVGPVVPPENSSDDSHKDVNTTPTNDPITDPVVDDAPKQETPEEDVPTLPQAADKDKQKPVENKTVENKDVKTTKAAKKKAPKKPKAPLKGAAGRPSPLQILRDEKAKTLAVREKFQGEHAVKQKIADEKKQAMPVELEALQTQLDQDAAEKLGVSRESVETLTKAVEGRGQTIQSLQEQLKKELDALQAEKKELTGAQTKLTKETTAVNKEQAATYRAKETELSKDVKAASKEERQARSALNKNVRKEKAATFKNTLKGSLSYAFGIVAAVPDVVVRSVRSLWGMAAETLGTFNRVAKRSSTDYKKNTWFTKFRN